MMVGGEHLLSVALTIAEPLFTPLLHWEQQLARGLHRSFFLLQSGFSVHAMLAKAAAAVQAQLYSFPRGSQTYCIKVSIMPH